MPFLNSFTSLFTARPQPMKLGDLESNFLSTGKAAGDAADVLASAKFDYDQKTSAATKATSAFASAIVAKGGEVNNTATGVTYRSADGLTVKGSKMVTMDDDAPDTSPVAADPTTDPNAPAAQ